MTSKNQNEIINLAVDALNKGWVFIFPTDTAYGMGCDAANEDAVKKIFIIKKRSKIKSLPVIAANLALAKKFFIFSKKEEILAKKYWAIQGTRRGGLAGKLSLVLRIKTPLAPLYDKLARGVVAKDGTVAVRAPNYALVQKISFRLGRPIVSTSANLSGKDSCYSIDEVKRNFFGDQDRMNLIDLIIDAGELPKVPVSTVARVKDNEIEILREGGIKQFQISNN